MFDLYTLFNSKSIVDEHPIDCPFCKGESKVKEWDALTRLSYGTQIQTIYEGLGREYDYICPRCKKKVSGSDFMPWEYQEDTRDLYI